MNVSFFCPIYATESQENLSFLRYATTIFDFGQKSYKIEVVKDELYLFECEASEPSWLMVALQVILIATVILPLIALSLLTFYRLSNSFKLAQDHISQLPDDILNIICQKAPSLALVNKKM